MENYKNLTTKQINEELKRLEKVAELRSKTSNDSRAQSINIGTAGGGATEITMRGVHGDFLWNVYQPVEVIELINQLAAGIGCHIAIQPRKDFASWREWKHDSDHLPFMGVSVAPFANMWPDFASHPPISRETGGNLPSPEEQPGLKPKLEVKEKENVATKKAVNKRSAKRSRTTSK
tara:strand:+ start:4122 stop:4652 length:531 start_codon:yes stop_codon:yes gene_type:complete